MIWRRAGSSLSRRSGWPDPPHEAGSPIAPPQPVEPEQPDERLGVDDLAAFGGGQGLREGHPLDDQALVLVRAQAVLVGGRRSVAR